MLAIEGKTLRPRPVACSTGAVNGEGADLPAEMAWYWPHAAVPGVNLLRARYVTHRYGKHTHETYTMALIEEGIEEFSHAGSLLRAGRGSVVLVNPEVVHTGHAGLPAGWTYRAFYPPVSVVEEVAAELGFRPGTPRFREAVVDDARSARLLDRGVPVAQAAVTAGFADQAHFTRHFKRIVGVPPGAYQRARGTALRNCVQDRSEGHRVPSAL
jgi:AraC-like DNA-binding protein